MNSEDRRLTPRERACWALLGDPYSREPIAQQSTIDRVEQAIHDAGAQFVQRAVEANADLIGKLERAEFDLQDAREAIAAKDAEIERLKADVKAGIEIEQGDDK